MDSLIELERKSTERKDLKWWHWYHRVSILEPKETKKKKKTCLNKLSPLSYLWHREKGRIWLKKMQTKIEMLISPGSFNLP